MANDKNANVSGMPSGVSAGNTAGPKGNLEDIARKIIAEMEAKDKDAGTAGKSANESTSSTSDANDNSANESSVSADGVNGKTAGSDGFGVDCAGSAEGVAGSVDANKCSDSDADAGTGVTDSDTNDDVAGDAQDELDGDLAQAAAEALEKAQAEVADWKDKYLRLHAEWDTYRRRTNEQRANEKLLATEKLVNEILPVLDDFERTINYATENGEQGLLDGVRAVQTKLHGVLEKSGLEQLDPAGEPFDALQHQAVATVEDTDAFDETVHEVYQKGYKMGTKVLRPAMVTVTTGGPKRPKDDDAEDAKDED